MSAFPPARRVRLPRHALPDGSVDPGIALAVHELGAGPAVVFCHGFPELAYSWRHQLPALAAAGFRAIAPDQRGYGGSDRPEPIAAYDMHCLTGDLVALLDALEIERAVFVGHDWGGFVAWAMPVLHPERCAGAVGVNTPYLARSPVPPTTLMRMLVGAPDGSRDERLYILWFQRPGVAEAVLARDVHRVFEVLMRRAIPLEELMARAAAAGTLDMNPFRRLSEVDPVGEPLLSPEEMDVYVRSFERTGFAGAVNWYRNFDRNWEIAPAVGTARIAVPSLMVTAQWDPVLRPEHAAGMPALVPDLETVMIERCGHWTQQEKPDALNRILLDWLGRRFRPAVA